MKKSILPALIAIIVAVLLIPLISGCGSRTPEQTVSGFFKAIEDGNYNKAKTFITTRMRNEAGDSDEAFDEMAESPGMEMGDNPWADADNLLSEITGDTANVWHKDFSMMKWVLKKEGGKWKIDDVDFDFADMMEGLGDLMPEDFEMPEGIEMPGS